MGRKDYIDLITSQRESIDQLRDMVSDLRETIRTLNEAMALRDSQNVDLLSQVARLTASLSYANEELAVRNKEKYGRSSHGSTIILLKISILK